MIAYERKKQIMEILRASGGVVTVEKLCAVLYASGATIRRDLKELEESRLLRRTRGGAVLMDGSGSEEPLVFREEQNVDSKQIIASLAEKHLRDGMTIFLDSSSTTLVLAQRLERWNNIRVITNGLKTALLLSEKKNITLMCTGGTLRENSKSLIGQSACGYIGRFNADLAFLSCRGFSIGRGVSEASEEECHVKARYIENSKKALLLCDTSKMDADFLCRLAPLSDFYEVITERREITDLCNRYTKIAASE